MILGDIMDLIKIYNKNGVGKYMEVVSTIEIKELEYHYIIYKDKKTNRYYAAKYKESEDELDTNLSKEELDLCNSVLEEVK